MANIVMVLTVKFASSTVLAVPVTSDVTLPQQAKTADVLRKNGISAATFYKFKAKFGGMEVSDARRLKALDDGDTRLKKLLAEQMVETRS